MCGGERVLLEYGGGATVRGSPFFFSCYMLLLCYIGHRHWRDREGGGRRYGEAGRVHLPLCELCAAIDARVQVDGALSRLAGQLTLVGGGASADVSNLALCSHQLAQTEPLLRVVGVGATLALGAILIDDLGRRAPATAIRNLGNAVSAICHRSTRISSRIKEAERR